jgi:hypothetical protein
MMHNGQLSAIKLVRLSGARIWQQWRFTALLKRHPPPAGRILHRYTIASEALHERGGKSAHPDHLAAGGAALPAVSRVASAEAAVRAPPDSYTLLLLTPSNVINATLYETLNFDFTRHTSPGRGQVHAAAKEFAATYVSAGTA